MRSHITRRRALQAFGATAVVASAGCTSIIGGSTSAAGDTITLPSVVTEGDLPNGPVPLVPDGKVSFVNFFATWCRPCQKEMPALRKLRAEYDSDELHMVSVTPQAEDALIREYWEQYQGTWPVVKDTSLEATAQYDANSYPTNLLFDEQGEPAGGGDPEVGASSFEGLKSLVDPLVQ